MEDKDQQQKTEGKEVPIKLTPEQLSRRKETGYSTNEESKKVPHDKGGETPSNNEVKEGGDNLF